MKSLWSREPEKYSTDQLIQATLLDVIDRGNVSIISEGDAVGLKLVKEDGLSSFEKDCLNLAFSGKKKKLFQFVCGLQGI